MNQRWIEGWVSAANYQASFCLALWLLHAVSSPVQEGGADSRLDLITNVVLFPCNCVVTFELCGFAGVLHDWWHLGGCSHYRIGTKPSGMYNSDAWWIVLAGPLNSNWSFFCATVWVCHTAAYIFYFYAGCFLFDSKHRSWMHVCVVLAGPLNSNWSFFAQVKWKWYS
jgi:hypothetical protein